MFIWVALKENVRSARILWIVTEICSNQGFLPVLQKNCQKQKPQGNLMPKRYLHGPTIWKVMQRNAWKDIANLRIKQRINNTKSQRHAWMIINVKKNKMDQLENSPQFAHKLFWNVSIWHVLEGLIFHGLWTKLLVGVTKWTKCCDKRVGSFDLLVLSCGLYCQTMQAGTVSRLRFCGRSWDSKSTSGGTICIFGSHTLVPISWMCKKQTSVLHSSTESEIISLDAVLRLDGIPALDWRKKCDKIEISSHVPTSSSSAKSPIASKSLGILTAAGKLESRMGRNSKSDAASSSQPRL